ncbi:uncharacterized protein C21orf62 [Clupea harengus]|uniref:Uncharacterized protein C21orf62 n=1 Tax=Clupea harengus TaxID=7950 RepID=A0A6P8GAX2_CLUHA|nr:uncharacterized protein C21orf62 [Clupea harengus]XP_031436453.1 uncharacterized protein C21orf62 [Clupea harengus]XP_042565442.1 uncharacterized protein C21orf62 [Clupea harengus]
MALPWLWPWLLWAVTTSLPLVRHVWAEPGVNSTLLFRSVSHGNSLRSCSCDQVVADCDEALANLLCSCQTLTPAGRHQNYTSQGTLSVWVRDPRQLWDWLSGAEVSDLCVCVCAPLPPLPPLPLSTPPLALLGLRRLQLRSFLHHQGATSSRHRSLLLQQPTPSPDHQGAPSSSPAHHTHLVLLDAAALSGESALRAYSVVAPLDTHTHAHAHTHSLAQHFLQLTLPHTLTHPADKQQPCLLTFVY